MQLLILATVPPLRISCRSSSLGARHSPETNTVPTSGKQLCKRIYIRYTPNQIYIRAIPQNITSWATFEKLRFESSARVDSLFPHVANLSERNQIYFKDIDEIYFNTKFRFIKNSQLD